MGQALRKQGFDEHVAASEYIALAQMLAEPGAKVTPANKARLDVLKECTRHLENAQKAERSAEEAAVADAPVMVQLVHAVPRPDRVAAEARNSKDESRYGPHYVSAASNSSPR